MKPRPKKAYSEAEKRKKIAIFLSLCVGVVLVITMLVVLFAVFKSESEDKKRITFVRVFTNLESSGHTGPNDKRPYRGTVLEREVVVVDGIQLWKVPFAGIWYVEVYGAAGADGIYAGHNQRLYGGLGARVTGKLRLREGELLKILVGQQGARDDLVEFRAGSGGGGTFVVSKNDQPIMVAGGGGGGGVPELGTYTAGGGGAIQYNDDKGKGGKLFDPKQNITVTTVRAEHLCIAGAGGGFHGDGAGYLKGWGGRAFIHGGKGGFIQKQKFNTRTADSDNGYNRGGTYGGFGGGGASGLLPGGGGGFVGGDVRGAYLYNDAITQADGGSSYNVAIRPTITPGVNKKDGRVFVKYLAEEDLPFGANHTADPRIPKTREQWYEEA